MIMGHINFGSHFDKYIHAFHMPMFFIISGFFYKNENINTLLFKRLKSLIVPYYVFGLFHIFLYSIIYLDFKIDFIKNLFWEITLCVPIAGALWFLPAMFFANIFYALIQSSRMKESVKIVFIILFSILGMILSKLLPFRLPWALDAAFVSIGLIYCGRLIREKYINVIKLRFIQSLILFFVFAFLIFFNGYINMRTGQYANWLLFWINAVGMSTVLLNLSRITNQFLNRNTHNIFKSWLHSIGANSIVYLCLNQLAILATQNLLFAFIPHENMNRLILLVVKMIIFVLTLIMLFSFQKLICNTKLRIIIGKS